MNRKKVLLVVPLPPPWAGVEQVSQTLVNSSLQDRYDLKVLKSNVRDSNATKGKWDFAGISRVLMICGQLLKTLIQFRPNLVYLTLSQNTSGLARDLAYIFLAKIFRVPVVAHFHGSKLNEYLLSRNWVVRTFLIFSLSSLSHLVVCAHSIEESLKPLLPTLKSSVIYNACPSFPDSIDHENDTNSFIISFMGHLSTAKGFYDAISAAEPLLEKFPEIKFEFAGERLDIERNVPLHQSSTLSKWEEAERLKSRFSDRVHFLGIITGKEKAAFFQRASVFIFPSYAESFGVAVIEAMSYGLPVIITPVGALPEFLEEGVNGFFIPMGQPLVLAERLRRLYENQALRGKMGEANREKASTFSVEKMADSMAAIFNAIMKTADEDPLPQ